MHQRVHVAERLSHAKSLRDIEYFPRRIYLSQCIRIQYDHDKCSRIKRSEFNIAERP